ncbi:MarR family winged helix-turn-helix transcriptional regulator [Rhodococcus sp. NPDC060086]|uniref:MarR family winged helix-turn-helix transcriptional regulator n=1 Tax=unclassified Rhodococcus (in: high G+C Gram-positive bacteria) TaxID=192944 RepID=UPI003656EDE4
MTRADTSESADPPPASAPAAAVDSVSELDPVPGLEQGLVVLWRRVRGLIRERALAVHPKLDPVCYPMLMMLRRADAVAMADLHADLGIEKSTLTRRIDSTVRLGLVERTPDPNDARARLLALTPSCRDRLNELESVQTEQWRARLSDWDTTDIRRLSELLGRLGDSIEDHDG